MEVALSYLIASLSCFFLPGKVNCTKYVRLTVQHVIPVGGGLDNMGELDKTLLGVDIVWRAEGGEGMDPATDLNILH